MNEVNDVYQNYFSQAINWFESAINTNDDSFSSLQMTCLQNFLSACFKQTETLDKNGKRHILTLHRKLMESINEIHTNYLREKKSIARGEVPYTKSLEEIPMLLGRLKRVANTTIMFYTKGGVAGIVAPNGVA